MTPLDRIYRSASSTDHLLYSISSAYSFSILTLLPNEKKTMTMRWRYDICAHVEIDEESLEFYSGHQTSQAFKPLGEGKFYSM
jgi:hypothetical protein